MTLHIRHVGRLTALLLAHTFESLPLLLGKLAHGSNALGETTLHDVAVLRSLQMLLSLCKIGLE